jgi:hypothetical protein
MILDSPIISGSSTVTGNLTVLGTLTASVSGSVTSASYATNAETLDGLDSTSFTTTSSFNTTSGSFSTRVTNLESFSSSLDATFATDAQLTAVSQSFSSSLSTVSGSLSSRIANNEATGSSLTTASSSFSTRVTNTEATASSLVTASGSFSTRTTNLETASGSFSTRVTNTEATASSLTTASSSFSTRTTNLETASGSFSTRVTNAESSITSLNSKTGSYATTGSNIFVNTQYISATNNPVSFTSTASLYTDGGVRVTKDMYVSGTAYFNNVTVYGTQSVQYITSSQLNISTNIITVNTDTPTIRFGGLSVYDSGSTGLTGSILWDSEANHWVYTNPSGSNYSGGMLISGPRSSALGSEQGTTLNALMKGQGGDHITSSAIIENGTLTSMYSTMYVSSSGNVGVGTSTPAYTLDVNGTGRFTGNLLVSVNQNNSSVVNISNTTAGTAAQSTFQANSDTTSGYATFGKFSSLNSGYKIIAASNAFLYTDKGDIAILNDNASGTIKLAAGGSSSAQLTISSTGNLGLGVTPSAWVSGIGRSALQVGITSISTNAANDSFYGTNYYDDGTNNRYINSDFSLIYAQQNGNHIWYNASSGTAGNAISFTQAMTLNASGNLSIGNTNNTYKLDVSGTGYFSGQVNAAIYLTLSEDGTYTGTYYTLGFSGKSNGANRIFAARDGSDGIYFAAATNRGFEFRPNGSTTGTFFISPTGIVTIAGPSSTPVALIITTGNSNCDITLQSTNSSSVSRIRNGTNDLQFHTNGTLALTLASNQAATFSSTVAVTTTGTTAALQVNLPADGNATILSSFGSNSAFGWYLRQDEVTTGDWRIFRRQVNVDYQVLNLSRGTGAATFASTVTAANLVLANSDTLTWGGAYGANIPTLVGVNGASGYFAVYPAGSTGGEKFRITNSGNVGIGTTAPVSLLDVQGPSGTAGSVLFTLQKAGGFGSTDFYQYYNSSSDYGINIGLAISSATNGRAGIIIRSDTSGNGTLVFNTTSAERMRISSVGDLYVINTTAAGVNSQSLPGAFYLEGYGWNTSVGSVAIQGRINLTGSYEASSGSTEPSLVFSLKGSGGGNVIPAGPSSLTERMRVTNAGNVGIGTTSPSQKLEVVGGEIKAGRVDSSNEGGQISFGRASDNATGYYIDVYGNTSTPQLRFVDVSNSAVRITLGGDGNVGIGTTSPAASLHVVGNEYIAKSGGGGTYKQTVVGQTTAAASGVAKKIAYVGFTHSVRVYVWANQSAAHGSSAIADICTVYGASSGGTVVESNFGNVTDIGITYNNGGSPAYTIDVSVTYSGTAPTINYVIEGISHDNNIYTI